MNTLVKAVTSAAAAAYADRKLLEQLIDIRSAKADDLEGIETDASYESAFHEAGLEVTLAPEQAGAIIRAKPAAVAQALAAAIDDWAAVRRDLRQDGPGAGRLVQVARIADADPWRNRLRSALETPDKQARMKSARRTGKRGQDRGTRAGFTRLVGVSPAGRAGFPGGRAGATCCPASLPG